MFIYVLNITVVQFGNMNHSLQMGQTFRIKGKGLPEVRGSRRGDQVVRIHIVVPSGLTEYQRNLLQQLGETLPDYRRPVDQSDHGFWERVKGALGG